MANKVGRPTKYTPDMIKVAKDYIASCNREATELPTIEGLSLVLGVDDTTVGLWAEQNPGFLATIKDLKAKQKTQLINDGMYGGKEVNSTMAIFLLKVNHGMIETERKQLVGADGESIKILVSTGAGFIPAPTGGVVAGQPPVQDTGLAQTK